MLAVLRVALVLMLCITFDRVLAPCFAEGRTRREKRQPSPLFASKRGARRPLLLSWQDSQEKLFSIIGIVK